MNNRNQSCECGSGKKTKRCCQSPEACAKRAAIEKKAYMDKQKLMPLEKRVAIIEEYLYDSNIVDRLKSLEVHHHTYA